MGEDIEEFLLNTKPARLLVSLRQQTTDNYASSLSTQVDATYSHTVKVLQRLESFGLVEFRKEGRKKVASLTSKGEDIAEAVDTLLRKLQGTETR